MIFLIFLFVFRFFVFIICFSFRKKQNVREFTVAVSGDLTISNIFLFTFFFFLIFFKNCCTFRIADNWRFTPFMNRIRKEEKVQRKWKKILEFFQTFLCHLSNQFISNSIQISCFLIWSNLIFTYSLFFTSIISRIRDSLWAFVRSDGWKKLLWSFGYATKIVIFRWIHSIHFY